MISEIDRNKLSLISGNDARETVAQLVTTKDRIAGSRAEQKSAEQVREKLAPFVDSIVIEHVPITAYDYSQASLYVAEPIGLSVPCIASRLSGSGEGTAPLVDGGFGSRRELDALGDRIRGSVLLLTSRSLFASLEDRMCMCVEARTRGAKCIIYHIEGKDDDVIAAHVSNVDFPTLIISNRSAETLRNLLSGHSEVNVRYSSVIGRSDGTTPNVIGTIVGSEFPNEIIYITAHHDSWFYGANDNLSSVACLIEAAKMFQTYRPRRTIRFVVFGSEESGPTAEETTLFCLGGSWGYSRKHREALVGKQDEIVIGVINGEFMGYSERMQVSSSPELVPLIRDGIANLDSYARACEPPAHWTCSDHFAFHTLGVPSVLFWQSSDMGAGRPSPYYGVYHSDRDDMSMIKPSALEKNGRLMGYLALRLDAIDAPYSTDALCEAGLRGLRTFPDESEIRRVFDDAVSQISNIDRRDERLRRILDFIAAVNTNLYTMVGFGFSNKFETIDDATAKLKDAAGILGQERDMERARAVISTIPNATRYYNFSKAATDRLDKMAEASEAYDRISRYALDLRNIFEAMDGGGVRDDVLSLIRSKIAETVNIREAWCKQYASTLLEVAQRAK